MSKHTPELLEPSPGPWTVGPSGMSIKDADGRWIGFYLYDEDAERVVACIAACTGIPTDSLKEGAVKELVDVAESVIPSLIENNYIADVEALKTVLARFKEED